MPTVRPPRKFVVVNDPVGIGLIDANAFTSLPPEVADEDRENARRDATRILAYQQVLARDQVAVWNDPDVSDQGVPKRQAALAETACAGIAQVGHARIQEIASRFRQSLDLSRATKPLSMTDLRGIEDALLPTLLSDTRRMLLELKPSELQDALGEAAQGDTEKKLAPDPLVLLAIQTSPGFVRRKIEALAATDIETLIGAYHEATQPAAFATVRTLTHLLQHLAANLVAGRRAVGDTAGIPFVDSSGKIEEQVRAIASLLSSLPRTLTPKS
jgi:hypothetical protein